MVRRIEAARRFAVERAEGRKMTRGHNFKPHLLFPWVDEIVHSHLRDGQVVERLVLPADVGR